MKVRRIYVQKKEEFRIEEKSVLEDLKESLKLKNLENLIILNRYDVSGISDEAFEEAKTTIFSEPQVELYFEEEYTFDKNDKVFGVESLPGQFDQRASSLSECLGVLNKGERPICKTAKMYILRGDLTEGNIEKIKKYLINPVVARICNMNKPESIEDDFPTPEDIKEVTGFINMTDEDAKKFYEEYGFAMDLNDLKFCQEYFKSEEKRDPTITEMKMIDTYWSDHCRHTTFLTRLEKIDIKWDLLQEVYEEYLKSRDFVYDGKEAKDICLMDIATITMKELKKQGLLKDLDESKEINACTIKAEILVDGKPEEYLIMFKNETHNHPTEIEPYGGANTCLGGAIRDPLSGRAYVYQAMRVTGCGDPTKDIEETLPNKLPQKVLTTTAAKGYSTYGKQIGLATGQVTEIYHSGYVAKRMEMGALVGAVPKSNVVREEPVPGDKVILLGAKTGRDGCGAATSSSKAHNSQSAVTCGSEVQTGDAPEERKIVRLFRNPEVTKMIKRCNDFGAGGVSVAIGELADGLEIELDKVPTKYPGLDGTELAIAESQERMAVVISAKDVEKFTKLAEEENSDVTVVATVTENPRVKMYWRGKTIVDISRRFLDTNGTVKEAKIEVNSPKDLEKYFYKENNDISGRYKALLQDLNCCSQKGLIERFDATVGSGTILSLLGGKHQLTPTEAMCAKIPTLKGDTDSGTIMAYGYDPYLSTLSPFHGAVYSTIEAVSKYVAVGGDYKKGWLTLQEYFEKLKDDPTRWGKPFVAMLGAYHTQKALGIAAVGGKDSMSGSFNEIDVPPNLTAFCVGVVDTKKVVSNEFKKANSKVVILKTRLTGEYLPDFDDLKDNYEIIHELISTNKVLSVSSIRQHGIADVVFKMCVGNKIGFKFAEIDINIFNPMFGSFIIELVEDSDVSDKLQLLGETIEDEEIILNNEETLNLEELIKLWQEPLEKVFPTYTNVNCTSTDSIKNIISNKTCNIVAKNKFAKPRIFIPVFPGTSGEYDAEKAFEDAGGNPNIVVFKDMKGKDIEESIIAMEKAIKESQILMIPGGSSTGDEPDGAAKFITTVFRNSKIKEAIHKYLNESDGLILGVGNGFQALIKLGLIPYGEIMNSTDDMPVLTLNTIARHQAKFVRTKVVSKLSPWFNKVDLGEEFILPISNSEGRFVVSNQALQELIANGQIATQYVDMSGNATYDIQYNPSNSMYAVESITNIDGRILGRMSHDERTYKGLIKNVTGNMDTKLFESGVEYFK